MYFLFIIPILERNKQGSKRRETEEALPKCEPATLITLCCSSELCDLPLIMPSSAVVYIYIHPLMLSKNLRPSSNKKETRMIQETSLDHWE